MALLGLFGKKDKKAAPAARPTPAASSSAATSPDGDYVLAERALPSEQDLSAPSGVFTNTGASGSKLKLPFRRKQSKASVASSVASNSPSPQKPRLSESSSYAGTTTLLRPPSRAALFTAYGDPQSALSTRSLPTSTEPSHARTDSQPSALTVHASGSNLEIHKPNPTRKKSSGGGILSWTPSRERTKSKPSPPSPSSEPPTPDSFNLKSFRHVRAESPGPLDPPARPPSSLSMHSNLSTNALPAPTRPGARPRGDSIASDSSQRVSVALFREAAARRTNSPAPSLRPPSIGDTLHDGSPRPRSVASGPAPGAGPRGRSQPQVPTARHPRPRARSATAPLFGPGASSSEDDSADDGSSDSDADPLGRQRTITPKDRARSEAGHAKGARAVAGARSELGHGAMGGDARLGPSVSRMTHRPGAKSESMRDVRAGADKVPPMPASASAVYSRPQVSVSTARLAPNASRPSAITSSQWSRAFISTIS